MKTEVQSKKGLRTILSVFVDKKTIQQKMDERLNELQKEVSLKGFRTGKVPTSVIKSQFGKSIYGEVIDKILRETSTKAIEENITDKTPATIDPESIETLASPNNFFHKEIVNQPTREVIIAILRTFIPKALNPPSANSKDWITTTIEIQIIPRLGPKPITAKAPPSKWPLVPAAIGKFIIWRTKIKADIIPVNAINLSATKLFALLI